MSEEAPMTDAERDILDKKIGETPRTEKDRLEREIGEVYCTLGSLDFEIGQIEEHLKRLKDSRKAYEIRGKRLSKERKKLGK